MMYYYIHFKISKTRFQSLSVPVCWLRLSEHLLPYWAIYLFLPAVESNALWGISYPRKLCDTTRLRCRAGRVIELLVNGMGGGCKGQCCDWLAFILPTAIYDHMQQALSQELHSLLPLVPSNSANLPLCILEWDIYHSIFNIAACQFIFPTIMVIMLPILYRLIWLSFMRNVLFYLHRRIKQPILTPRAVCINT
jgi:hypothetical protein